MSGGAFEYRQNQIDWIIDGIEEHLTNQGTLTGHDDYLGQPEYYAFESEEVQERMRHAIKALKIAKIYAQRVDWYLSGDDGEESFLEKLDRELDNLDMP